MAVDDALSSGCMWWARQGLTCDLFRVRELRGAASTCAGWGSVLPELGRWRAGGDRCCPLRSGCLWPGCGPDVAQRSERVRRIPAVPPPLTPHRPRRSDAHANRPLLSVRGLHIRARGGHGWRGPTRLRRGGDSHKLNRRVRPDHDDHLLLGKRPAGRAAVEAGVSRA
jgi:hypothetical protein